MSFSFIFRVGCTGCLEPDKVRQAQKMAATAMRIMIIFMR